MAIAIVVYGVVAILVSTYTVDKWRSTDVGGRIRINSVEAGFLGVFWSVVMPFALGWKGVEWLGKLGRVLKTHIRP